MRILIAMAVSAALFAGSAAPAAAASPLDPGLARYRRGDLQGAEAAFRAAARVRPSHEAWAWLGVTLYGLRRYREAAEVFHEALRYAPRDARTWLWWGYALAKDGNLEAARRVLHHVLLLASEWSSPGILAAQGLRAIAALPVAQGARSAAASRARRSIHLALLNPATYQDFARFFNPGLQVREARRIGEAILGYSARYDVDPRLVVSLIAIESGFHPTATSPKGAMGLGQLMPSTAASMGVQAYDSQENIYGTVRVLRGNLDHFGWENLDLALAAYNAGKGAVQRYGGIPPFPETQWYVQNVITLYRRILRLYAQASPP